MPKRPRSHQLEDRSRAKFALLKPDAWVFRDKNKDYGIDGEVEVFGDDGSPSGLLFYVQLKATDSARQKDALSLSIDLDALEYFKSLDVPVLIARYVEKTDAFFIKWASKIDPYYAKRKAQTTLTISFTEADRWTASTPKELETHLAKRRHLASNGLHLPTPLFLRFEVEQFGPSAVAVWASALRMNLKDFSGVLSVVNTLESALVTVTLRSGALVVSASDLFGCVFDNVERLASTSDAPRLVAEQILIGLCVIHVQSGHSERAGQLIKGQNLKDALVACPDAAIQMLPGLFRSGWFEMAIEIAEAVEATQDAPEASLALQAAMLMREECDPERDDLIESALLRRIGAADASGDAHWRAMSRYNLANFFRGRRQRRKALREYVRALRADRFYERQAYFFAELGGLFFDSGHFKWALVAYRHALTLGNAEPEMKALCADAAMFAGKYEEATQLFTYFFADVKEPDAEWILKARALKEATAMLGRSEQARQPILASKLADVSALSEHGKAVEQLEQALQLDLLCGLAWFNLGNAKAVAKDYLMGAFAYVFCGLIQRWDIEAWVHGTLCFLAQQPVLGELPLVVRAAYGIHEDKYLAHLYSRMQELGWPTAVASGLAQIIEPLVAGAKRQEVRHLRLPDDDGLMRPVEDIIQKAKEAKPE